MLMIDSKEYLFVNVYLPYYCNDNFPEYLMYMGKISTIIDSCNADGIMILGDLNADIDGAFYNEVQQLCNTKDFIVADVAMLPGESYTHINNASLTRSWLDHCLASEAVGAVERGTRAWNISLSLSFNPGISACDRV